MALENEEYSFIVRDATLQRFEYTVELFWKTLQAWLFTIEGIECASPKKCIRTAASLQLLDTPETEEALQMIDDRNLISHSYLEEIAMQIYGRCHDYALLMGKVLDRISSNN